MNQKEQVVKEIIINRYLAKALYLLSMFSLVIIIIFIIIIVLHRWVHVQGFISIDFSPIYLSYQYFGIQKHEPYLYSIRIISLYTSLLVVVSGFLLLLSYVRELNINYVLGLAYAFFTVSFIYSNIIIPILWLKLGAFPLIRGATHNYIRVNTLAGVIYLGALNVYKWSPITLSSYVSILSGVAIIYAFFRAYKEL